MKATHKIVNGKTIPLAEEEAAQIEAEWAANYNKPNPTIETLETLILRAKDFDDLKQSLLERGRF